MAKLSNEEAKVYASTARDLITGRTGLTNLWQKLAEHLYPEQADFTTSLEDGDLKIADLYTSRPVSSSQELAETLAMTLRPEGKQWFYARTKDYEYLDNGLKQVLHAESMRLYSLMYNKRSGFSETMGLSDRSISVFGNAVLSCETTADRRNLLFRSWHLKDCAWVENYDYTMGAVFRRWDASPQEVLNLFPDTASDAVRDMVKARRERGSGGDNKTVEIYHCFMETERYMGATHPNQKRYTSLFYDIANETILRCVETDKRFYSVARWARRWGSQYGYSKAAERSLPDAAMAQDMSKVLLKAGEMTLSPTMVEKAGVLRSDVNMYAGGLITLDSDYNQRTDGEAIYALDINGDKIPFGADLLNMTLGSIDENHYKGVIGLPPLGGGMSPYEISERIADYLRKSSPLIAPLEVSYSNDLCDLAWNVALHSGLIFPEGMPEGFTADSIEFSFVNPLIETENREKGNALGQALGIVAQVSQFDPSFRYTVDYAAAGREALEGTIGVSVLNDKEYVAEQAAQEEQAKQAESQMVQMQQAAGLVKEGSEAALVAAQAGSALGGMGEI